MAPLIPALVAGLAWALSSVIVRIITAIGVAFVTYNYGLPGFMSFIQSNLGASSHTFQSIAHTMGLDIAISMVLSAASIKAVSRLVVSKKS